MSTLPEFIARVQAATTPTELWHIGLAFFRERGIAMVSYHHYGIRERDSLVVEGMTLNADGFPEDWVDRYISDKLYRLDPIPGLTRHRPEPFYWKDVGQMTRLLEGQQAYMALLEEADFGDGLAIQVFGPDFRNGYVGLGFGPGPRPTLSPLQVAELQSAAQAAHLRYCALSAEDARLRNDLSPRETEILTWIARGKSNRVIADILGVSPHTIDTQIRRIFDKLGVADRTTAAIKGIGSGLLQTGDVT